MILGEVVVTPSIIPFLSFLEFSVVPHRLPFLQP